MPDDGDDDEGEGEGEAEIEYEVECVRARRVNADGVEEFRVRWAGFTWEEDSWEPRENVAQDLIASFEEMEARIAPKQKKESGRAGKAKKKGAMFVRF